MAIKFSPAVVTNGLVFNFDMSSPRSYKGPPLTNLLPNGIYAGYPTYPSGWGTYNTNQYGSGTYFSIGTISGVSGNIVTCNNHSLRTYDVVQPQTTAGGVTAGTNYLVRKWDANTFSLYTYDGTQDSYDPFNTQVNLNNDNKVALSSGITNMWWGYPHLPNAGVMKQIVTNGFRWQGRVHDCLRVHWYRADGVTDGMAYGNYATVSANTTYTISFWIRAATPNAVGRNIYCEQYVAGFDTSTTFTLNKQWTRQTITFTPTQSGSLNIYWFNSSCPAQSAWEIAEIMVYAGTSASNEYIASGSTRSSTQSIYDLTGNTTITSSGLTYNTDGTFTFNGSSSYLQFPYTQSAPNSFSVEAWIYHTSHSSDTNIGHQIVIPYSNYNAWILSLNGTASYLQLRNHNFNTSSTAYNLAYGTGLSLNTWYHVAATDNGTTVTLYVNGVAVASQASAAATSNGTMTCSIGAWPGAANTYFAGQIPVVRIYNRGLSASEIAQNFNAHRRRYGI